jgi:hypothetical protein
MRSPDAVQEMITPWVGGQMFPMLEYKDRMLQKRTGVSPDSQGLDPNSLNRGGAYETKVMNAAKQRIKLIGRVFAEVLLKPTFQGILKLLTDGEMEKVAFRLRDKFVEYDPNEWRDSYDMTSNVGLGTTDAQEQLQILQAIAQNQAMAAQSPYAPLLITPKHIYNTQAKLVENAGFKNVGDFWQDPGDKQVPPPQPPPDPSIQIKQMELQADAQKFQATTQHEQQKLQMTAQAKQQEQNNTLIVQQQNDERDAQRELDKAQYQAQLDSAQLEFDRYKVDADNRTRIIIAQLQKENFGVDIAEDGMATMKPDPIEGVSQAIAMLAQSVAMQAEQQSRPKQIIRGADGKVIGMQ